MNEVIKNLIRRNKANDFEDLQGLSIQGNIPIHQNLINELLNEFLKNGGASAVNLNTEDSSSSELLNATDLLKYVKKAEISAEAGKITLAFQITV